ncbi:MAG: hypothetical protein RIC87_21195, partial [Kiloniellales bacterium]
MGKAISNDLRVRLVRGIASGKSRRAVAAQFEVAPSTAVRIQARYATTGSVEPAALGRPKGSGKLGHYVVRPEKVRSHWNWGIPKRVEVLDNARKRCLRPQFLVYCDAKFET